MKRKSTINKRIPVTLFLTGMLSLHLTLLGQTSHSVTVSNYSFSPKELTISSGDTVIWTNTQGMHNVNGSIATYPSNLESFGNSLGSSWTYRYVFNITGNYDYRCDPHVASGMTGKIFVVGTATGYNSDLPGASAENQILIYPNPATNILTMDLQDDGIGFHSIRIMNLLGEELQAINVPSGKSSHQFNISDFNPGLYLIRVEIGNETSVFKFIKN